MPTNNDTIQTYLCEQIKNAIQKIDAVTTPDVYAISFEIGTGENSREVQAIFRYNACSNINKNINDKSIDENDAKWKPIYWLQNSETVIGGNDPKIEEWIRSLGLYFTDEEEQEDFDRCWELSQKFYDTFVEMIISISARLHQDGILVRKFGIDIPIIVCESMFSSEPLEWTRQSNPNNQAIEFESWMTQSTPKEPEIARTRQEKAYSLDWENKVFMSDDMKPVEVYKGIIDELVQGFPSTSVTIRSLLEKDYVSNDPSNAERCFLASLTPEQRELLALMFLNEREAAIFDVLELLTYRIDGGVRLTYNGEIMPTGISGEGLSGDYTARRLDAQGDGCHWEWPEDLSMATM